MMREAAPVNLLRPTSTPSPIQQVGLKVGK
jgi:hypothetical protein